MLKNWRQGNDSISVSRLLFSALKMLYVYIEKPLKLHLNASKVL